MAIGRTILAILFGFSVVLAPAYGAFATGNPPTIAGAAMAHDHQHHGHNCDPSSDNTTHKPIHDCGSFIGCALSCGSFTGVTASSIVYVPVVAAVLRPLRASETILSQMGSPPFRPPRA